MRELRAIVDVMRAYLSYIFESLGFQVSNFFFDHIITEPEIARRLRNTYSDTAVARILLDSPDLFLMHRKLKPKEGVLFIKCLALPQGSEAMNISVASWDTYKSYYPLDRIALVVGRCHASLPVVAEWASKALVSRTGQSLSISLRSMRPLHKFIESEFNMIADEDSIGKFIEELQKSF